VRNSARPRVRAQIAPRALEILDPLYRIPEGYTDDGVPNFTGLPLEVWQTLHNSKPKLYAELVDILHRDYPTFAALVQKIWAKKIGHLVPFIFNRTQLLEWDRITQRLVARQALFIAVLKARQQGISTLVNGMAHWQVWRLRDVECNLVVHEKPLAYSFMDRLRIFHEELPKVAGITRTLRVGSKTARVPKDEMYYAETRSKVTTVVAKNAETRGRSALHNHLAEYAFYDDAAGLLGSLMPQLPPAGSLARLQCSVIIESTPNGKNDFYYLWQTAKGGSSEWHADFFPWCVAEDEYSLTPPHGWKMSDEQREFATNLAHIREKIDGIDRITPAQMYWYETTLETECAGDQDKMDAEYPSDDETCFLLRSRSIFKHDMRYLHSTVIESERKAPGEFKKRNIVCTKSYLRGNLEYAAPDNPFGTKAPSIEQLRLHPKFVECPDGRLVIWAPPLDGHDYVIGIDPASGLMDSDNSVGELIDVTEGRQMGEYAGRVTPEKIADDCVAMGWWYNTALLYPEINSIGVVTMKRIKQLWMYPRLGREEKWDETGLKSNKYGHFSTNENKQIMVSFLRHIIQERFLAISSDALLSELSTFVQTYTDEGNEKFHADANNADDRVMALCLACMAIRQTPRLLADFTKEPHKLRLPNAIDMMINDSPTPSALETEQRFMKDLPANVREGLFGTEILSVPANPIRGLEEVLY
jgi:hypothetical protein